MHKRVRKHRNYWNGLIRYHELTDQSPYYISQSGRGHRDDRAKNGSENIQIFDYKMVSRGRFETFDI